MMVDAHMKDGRTFRLERRCLIELMQHDLLSGEELAAITCWARWRRDDPFLPILVQKISPGSIAYIIEVPRKEAQAFLAERLEHIAGRAA